MKTMQKLLSKTRQAIKEYNLIEDGDKISCRTFWWKG